MVAQREGYAIELVRADMTQTFPFEDETFDLIFHPVSNCYVEDVFHVWQGIGFRVLKPGGILLRAWTTAWVMPSTKKVPLWCKSSPTIP